MVLRSSSCGSVQSLATYVQGQESMLLVVSTSPPAPGSLRSPEPSKCPGLAPWVPWRAASLQEREHLPCFRRVLEVPAGTGPLWPLLTIMVTVLSLGQSQGPAALLGAPSAALPRPTPGGSGCQGPLGPSGGHDPRVILGQCFPLGPFLS